MGGQYEVEDGATKKYYSIAGMMVAVNDGTGLQYLLTDHLGSTVAVTNASGTLTSQQRYLPFGAARSIPNSPILGTDFTYTGQRLLDSGMGGIMDYRARFYSPALMRFLQPDSIIPDQSNPQSWNRFSYVLNSPIVFNDPTGHWDECENDPNCSHVLDTYVQAAIQMESPFGFSTRPRSPYGRNDSNRFTGLGLAKISDAEMEGKFGKIVDDEHIKVGLGLRDGPCDKGCAMDQTKPEVAAIAMRVRISMRLDVCVQNGCSDTDMFIVALLAGDERITPQALNQAFKNDKYNSDNGIVTLNWEKFLADNWPKKRDRNKNNDLMYLFSKNVKKLDPDVLSESEWEYVGGLSAQ
jgi:RHS repeat-associated protein